MHTRLPCYGWALLGHRSEGLAEGCSDVGAGPGNLSSLPQQCHGPWTRAWTEIKVLSLWRTFSSRGWAAFTKKKKKKKACKKYWQGLVSWWRQHQEYMQLLWGHVICLHVTQQKMEWGLQAPVLMSKVNRHVLLQVTLQLQWCLNVLHLVVHFEDRNEHIVMDNDP